jgi:hypothetical protein
VFKSTEEAIGFQGERIFEMKREQPLKTRTSSSVKDLGSQLFQCLQQMDSEANQPHAGYQTGLSWYGGHYRPDLKKPQTEPSWVWRLKELLLDLNRSAEREIPYPSLKQCKCDLRIALPSGDRLWLEVKGAWKDYWCKNNREWIYRPYLLHPLVADLDPKTHTAALDLQKLNSLTAKDAKYIGLLLIGFDSKEHPWNRDINLFMKLTGLDSSPWNRFSKRWPDPYRAGCRVNCSFWYREVV